MKIWDCKVGEVDASKLPEGADKPMRECVRLQYAQLTGQEPDFLITGWGAELTAIERASLGRPAVADQPKTYAESSIPISLECQGPWFWTAAVIGGDFEPLGILTRTQHHSPAAALRALADEFEKHAMHEIYYKRIGV
jgi:hypothetical protein